MSWICFDNITFNNSRFMEVTLIWFTTYLKLAQYSHRVDLKNVAIVLSVARSVILFLYKLRCTHANSNLLPLMTGSHFRFTTNYPDIHTGSIYTSRIVLFGPDNVSAYCCRLNFVALQRVDKWIYELHKIVLLVDGLQFDCTLEWNNKI